MKLGVNDSVGAALGAAPASRAAIKSAAAVGVLAEQAAAGPGEATDARSRHDVTPQAALQAVEDHVGPVLVDLDETLYLRNSTEDFIDCARPAVLALILLRMLDALRPWQLTGGEPTRDVWRLGLIAAFFPWTMLLWRWRVAGLAARHANRPLCTALRGRSEQPIIVTVGFRPVVAPLVRALGFSDASCVATRMPGFGDRRAGKLRMALAALGKSSVRRSLVITDSLQDLPLLDACARPLRVVWREARYRQALRHVYLPGQYLTQVKRPGERYILRGILQEDFAFWVLSSIALAAVPTLHVAGLLLLLASFWTIYERGYVDNDLIGAHFEEDPKLSVAFRDSPVRTPRWQPWLWAAALGAGAIALLRWPAAAAARDFAAWAAVLLGTYLWFTIYNRLDKSTRVWLFSGLQFARTVSFAAVVPIVPLGAAALGAHVLARWVPYYIYRFGAKDWPSTPGYLIRLLFFIVLAVLLAVVEGPRVLISWTGAALLGWNIYRARQELRLAFSSASRLTGGAQA